MTINIKSPAGYLDERRATDDEFDIWNFRVLFAW